MVVSRHFRLDREDVLSWTHSPDGWYIVKSTYSFLFKGLLATGSPLWEILLAVARVWNLWVPSKVVIFSWQLILDRIPARFNLVRCCVPLPKGGLGCVFCDAPSESSVHLFLSCPSIFLLFHQVSRWLGWEFVIPLGLEQQF